METITKILNELQMTNVRAWVEGGKIFLDDLNKEISIVRGMAWFSFEETEVCISLDDENLTEWIRAYCEGDESFKECLIEAEYLELTA